MRNEQGNAIQTQEDEREENEEEEVGKKGGRQILEHMESEDIKHDMAAFLGRSSTISRLSRLRPVSDELNTTTKGGKLANVR